MAAVTLGNAVLAGSDAKPETYSAGMIITAGQVVFIDPADGLLKRASLTSITQDSRVGIAISSVPTIGQYGTAIFEGSGTGATGLVQGTLYYVSATAGSVMPEADFTTGQRVILSLIAGASGAFRVFKSNWTGYTRA